MSELRLDLIAIKTEDGKYYLSERKTLRENWSHCTLIDYLIDGKKVQLTFEKEWVCVASKPKRITRMIKQPNVNYRYELQDKSLMSEKLPEFIDRDDVASYKDCEWLWKKDMSQYRSLYHEISDIQSDKEEVSDFDLEVVLEVSEIIDPVKMNYKVPKIHYSQDGFTEITEENVEYQLADKIIFPNIILPQRPCKFSSEQTYTIVRQYIKDNINPVVAKITSDYDFCFTVKKRIKFAEIKKYTVDVNNSLFQKRKRKPKYVEKQQIEREEECFEMTHSPKGYQGYTPIKGFEAKTQKELKEKIDTYCKEVISFINTPLVECVYCNGDGVIVSTE